MKKCENFKELILTDYIDGELDKARHQGLEAHLLDCGDCRSFLQEVKINAAMPFKNALPQPVPPQLWDTIRQNIEQEEQAVNPLAGLFDKLKGLVAFPRMVPVFASLILMFLAGSVTVNTVQIRQARDKDQGEYLISLLSPAGPSSQAENNDLGTPIEHYFL